MCTITLSYDQNNALARRKLSELLKSGLFTPMNIDSLSEDEDSARRKEVKEFIYASKIMASQAFANKL